MFEGEYLEGKKWNGKGYDKNGNIIYELKDGNGFFIEYDVEYGERIEFEGEYKNGEKNGKGKEYFDGILVFEGEFKNGKRNGKGKEYFDGQLVFEGEYLEGKIWNGKGKEYDTGTDVLLFEGEYVNGKRWNGIGFDSGKQSNVSYLNGNEKYFLDDY